MPRIVPILQMHLLRLLLDGGKKKGASVHNELTEHGGPRSSAAFYQLLLRMVELGLVDCEEDPSPEAQRRNIKPKRYWITENGRAAFEQGLVWYGEQLRLLKI